jgi:hypothetical protein
MVVTTVSRIGVRLPPDENASQYHADEPVVQAPRTRIPTGTDAPLR